MHDITAFIILGIIALICLRLYIMGGRPKNMIANDDRTLISDRLGLMGRPDRIIEEKGVWIPIEKKSAPKAYDSHKMQLCVYMMLIEDVTGRRPPYGYIELGSGKKICIKNTAPLRQQTQQSIKAIQAIKAAPQKSVKAAAFPAKCASCGYRTACTQAKI